MAKGHQVGVLFVHGMGEQGRGETIGQMGEAVAEWLRRETEARDPKASGGTLPAAGHGPQANKATIRHVALADPHPELPDTAQIHIAFEPKLNAQDKRKGGVATPVARWLLAESWWAQSFRPASFLDMAPRGGNRCRPGGGRPNARWRDARSTRASVGRDGPQRRSGCQPGRRIALARSPTQWSVGVVNGAH